MFEKEQKIIVIKQPREEKADTFEKELHVLCGEILLTIRLWIEGRNYVVCEIIAIDGENLAVKNTISESLQTQDKNPTRKEMDDLLKRVIEAAGIPLAPLAPVSERYAEQHRKLAGLKKRLQEGGKKW